MEPTQAAGRAFMMRQIKGSVVMLNLLRFRETADYSATPELASEGAISGAAAFQRYIEHTLPYLRETGGDLILRRRRWPSRKEEGVAGRVGGGGVSARLK
jgi:hypothetical protein